MSSTFRAISLCRCESRTATLLLEEELDAFGVFDSKDEDVIAGEAEAVEDFDRLKSIDRCGGGNLK